MQRRSAPSKPTRTRPSRWALTSDAAFVLLGTDLTLPTAFMRDYVAFVRDTTPAQRDALVQFIEKLDKGQA